MHTYIISFQGPGYDNFTAVLANDVKPLEDVTCQMLSDYAASQSLPLSQNFNFTYENCNITVKGLAIKDGIMLIGYDGENAISRPLNDLYQVPAVINSFIAPCNQSLQQQHWNTDVQPLIDEYISISQIISGCLDESKTLCDSCGQGLYYQMSDYALKSAKVYNLVVSDWINCQ